MGKSWGKKADREITLSFKGTSPYPTTLHPNTQKHTHAHTHSNTHTHIHSNTHTHPSPSTLPIMLLYSMQALHHVAERIGQGKRHA